MTLDYIKDQSGKHFDPEVVEAFLASYDVIAAIREKYQETSCADLPASPSARSSSGPAVGHHLDRRCGSGPS